MNSETSSSSFVDDDEVAAGIELLAAAEEGRGEDAVRILRADPDLIRTADMAGDMIFHVAARGGHVKTLRQLIRFLQKRCKQQTMLKFTVMRERNVDGDTALHVSIKNGHIEAAVELFRAYRWMVWATNKDGLSPRDLAEKGEYKELLEYMMKNDRLTEYESEDEDDNTLLEINDDDMSTASNNLPKEDDTDDLLTGQYKKVLNNILDIYEREISRPCPQSSLADIEMRKTLNDLLLGDEKEILQMLVMHPTLIRHRVQGGTSAIHYAAKAGRIGMMMKLLKTTRSAELSELVLKMDNNGNTVLHLAMRRWQSKHPHAKKVLQHLLKLGPEVAYWVNKKGCSPLYTAVESGYEDVVRYVFKVMPGNVVSELIKKRLVKAKKASIAHAAVKARNLGMLQVIMENLPSLINSFDEKGWRPLSYAAYKGYLNEVNYFIKKFPNSVKRFDSDGSLPMDKAICGGHVKVVKAFISRSPETLYNIDKKGRSILHIAVRYGKHHVLSYLKENTNEIEKVISLRDQDGKTFTDLAKELEHIEQGRRSSYQVMNRLENNAKREVKPSEEKKRMWFRTLSIFKCNK